MLWNGYDTAELQDIDRLLTPRNAIVKFTLTSDGTTPINATKLTIQVGDETITMNVSSATYSTNGDGVVYVAFPSFTSTQKAITLSATNGTKQYFSHQDNQTFSNAYHRITVTMNDAASYPLTFEAKVAGATVKFEEAAYENHATRVEFGENVKYQIIASGTAGDWITYPAGTLITLAKIGDKVRFKGTLSRYASSSYQCEELSGSGPQYASKFSVSNCYVYGNVMSLVGGDDFVNTESLTNLAFAGLFQNSGISNHPYKPLVLPATSLNISCYRGMFYNCSAMTVAPSLPATSVKSRCYESMFSKSGIMQAPELPATDLSSSCYQAMFKSCTALTKGPEQLPAQTLREQCYREMFSGCSRLTVAPIICATAFPAGNNTDQYSCKEMFSGCSQLQSVTCYANPQYSNQYQNTADWLSGVSATGTFYSPYSTSSNWASGASGIPDEWTRSSIQ